MAERKTLEGRGADLLAWFAQRNPAVFDVREASEYLAADAKATTEILRILLTRGWLVRHHRGVYEIAPLWATSELPYDPDRFAAIARWVPDPYYVAFRSAMEIRDWLDHPVRGRLWLAVPRPRHAPATVRDRVTWVVLRPDRFEWGRERHWVGNQIVWVSDPERTILDSLHLPRHVGGIVEVTAVLVRVWASLDQQRLIAHVDRLGIDSVRRRLGFLLETVDLPGGRDVAAQLIADQRGRRRSPVVLDPTLPIEGAVDRRWRVRVNLDPSEIAVAGQT